MVIFSLAPADGVSSESLELVFSPGRWYINLWLMKPTNLCSESLNSRTREDPHSFTKRNKWNMGKVFLFC